MIRLLMCKVSTSLISAKRKVKNVNPFVCFYMSQFAAELSAIYSESQAHFAC